MRGGKGIPLLPCSLQLMPAHGCLPPAKWPLPHGPPHCLSLILVPHPIHAPSLPDTPCPQIPVPTLTQGQPGAEALDQPDQREVAGAPGWARTGLETEQKVKEGGGGLGQGRRGWGAGCKRSKVWRSRYRYGDGQGE